MAKKKTSLQKRYDAQKKRINKILTELGKQAKLKEKGKIDTKYVDSLQKISKKELIKYFNNELTKGRTNVISRRLEYIDSDTNIIDVILQDELIIDASTGEILVDDFDTEEFSQIHPDHYEQYLRSLYPNYNFINLQELIDAYIDYYQIAKERLEAALDLPYKGARILRNAINELISSHGDIAFYNAVATMSEGFWEAIDIAAHYGDNEHEDYLYINRDVFEYNVELLMHMLLQNLE